MGEAFETRCCYKCKETKKVNRFYKNKTRKDGRDTYCSDCRKEYMNARAMLFQEVNDSIANKLRAAALDKMRRALSNGSW